MTASSSLHPSFPPALLNAGGFAAPWNGAGQRIYLQDVGVRDGLQSEGVFVPTEQKIAMVNALGKAGLAKIEVTAFVSAKAIPALADAEVVMREIERQPGVVYTAIAPNVRGAERAVESKVDELNIFMSATETHNLCNVRMTCEQSFAALKEVATVVRSAGLPVAATLSCAFGCPMEGEVSAATVLHWCQRFIEELGVRCVGLGDTTGMAYPGQVAALTQAFRTRWPGTELSLHFHNTRGLGMANVLAGISAGADRFDGSVGGIGGCPFAPGATGNICTEDTAHALGLMGYDTGVNVQALVAVAKQLPALLGHEVPSQVAKAGERLHLHPRPADFEAIRERALARQAA